jgi:hypothetical protein
MARAHGAYRVESWTAIPNDRLKEIVESIDSICEKRAEAG